MFRPIATVTAVGTVARAFGSTVETDMKKATMPARKCRIPALDVMAEASLTESHESLPHGLVARDSFSENMLIPEPRGLSSLGLDALYRAWRLVGDSFAFV
jgi:hypothetical protein